MTDRPSTNGNARGQAGEVGKAEISNPNPTPPIVTGQCGQVFGLIQQYQPLVSLRLTADYAIPEAAARVHDLRAMGFNILTTIHPTVMFRGIERRNVASYSLGTPAWPRPGFFDGGGD
ncbi:MAG: helix-turn-helix domain-containing protein [Azonexus sp.]